MCYSKQKENCKILNLNATIIFLEYTKPSLESSAFACLCNLPPHVQCITLNYDLTKSDCSKFIQNGSPMKHYCRTV